MEALGGDQRWIVRFLAQHSAIVYYWTLIVLFAISPSLAYLFSVLLEGHAVDTYEQVSEEEDGGRDELSRMCLLGANDCQCACSEQRRAPNDRPPI